MALCGIDNLYGARINGRKFANKFFPALSNEYEKLFSFYYIFFSLNRHCKMKVRTKRSSIMDLNVSLV